VTRQNKRSKSSAAICDGARCHDARWPRARDGEYRYREPRTARSGSQPFHTELRLTCRVWSRLTKQTAETLPVLYGSSHHSWIRRYRMCVIRRRRGRSVYRLRFPGAPPCTGVVGNQSWIYSDQQRQTQQTHEPTKSKNETCPRTMTIPLE
jgi:hypothetical protein